MSIALDDEPICSYNVRDWWRTRLAIGSIFDIVDKSPKTAHAHISRVPRASGDHSAFIDLHWQFACAQRDFPLGMGYIVAFRTCADCRSCGRPAVRSVAMRKVVLRESRLDNPSLLDTGSLPRWTWGASLKFEAEQGPRSFNCKAPRRTRG